jgi:hypothetical protein
VKYVSFTSSNLWYAGSLFRQTKKFGRGIPDQCCSDPGETFNSQPVS